MIKLITLFFVLFLVTINAKDFTVASYNVENLFDLIDDGTEYTDYKPNTNHWNKRALSIKLKNISKTIRHLNADILALQEIESKLALELLLKKLPDYKYSFFLKNPNSAVGVAIISKYEILETKSIKIDSLGKYSRPILMAKIIVDNKDILLYVNHWRSKRAMENTRTRYAVSLRNSIYDLSKDTDYILLGDFNSNYNEHQTFKHNRKLNNTYGITGINHILNTIVDEKFVIQHNMPTYEKQVHYNLWLELSKKQRFSYKFRGQNGTPDNILLSQGLFDNEGISYVDDSFKVFKPRYLFNKKYIYKWNKNKGFSDHLPIIATFTTAKIKTKNHTRVIALHSNTINHLYNIENITQPVDLKDVVVIYKHKNDAIVKDIKGRAVYIYGCADNLIVGYKYNLTVDEIEYYNDLLEVKNISNVKRVKKFSNYKRLYLNGKFLDLDDTKYTNEIVTNLTGTYKKGHLYFNNKKIKLYFPKNFKKPRKNGKIKVNSGHLAIYKGKVQILIHKKSDIKQYD